MNRRKLPLLWPAVLAAIALTAGCGKKESAPAETVSPPATSAAADADAG